MSKEIEDTAKGGASNTWIDRQFHLAGYGTTVRAEILAGITTSMTMVYALGTAPNTIVNAGPDRGIMPTSMILLAIVTTVAMALVTNCPFALASGLGSVAIVSGTTTNSGISPEITAGVIFWSSAIFIVISHISLKDAVANAIPANFRHVASLGVGLFIVSLGCKGTGPIIALEGKNNPASGNLSSPFVLLTPIGLLLIFITKQIRVLGYMIFPTLITALVGIFVGLTRMPEAFPMAPSPPFGQFMEIDFLRALQFIYLPFLVVTFVLDFFSIFGMVLGVGAKVGFLDEDGNLSGIDKVSKVGAVATTLGNLFCMPRMTTHLEPSSGVEAEGKTGLTPISTSVCLVLALLLILFALMVPSAATVPALIIIGVDIPSFTRNINYDDFIEFLPVFVCVALTIFANSITNGIYVALPVHMVLKLASGKIKGMSKVMCILLRVCMLYFCSIIKQFM